VIYLQHIEIKYKRYNFFQWERQLDVPVCIYTNMKDMKQNTADKTITLKNLMQNHLHKEFSFSHRIDIEPTPSHPIPWDEMNQRLRKICFVLNKKYLRTKYFPKWKMKDKFWFCIVRQGGCGTGSELHYHILLHSPDGYRIDVWNSLYWGWMKGSAANPMSGRRRPTWRYTKDKYHFGNEPSQPDSMIKVAPIQSNKGSVIYNTREMQSKMERIEEFICI